MKTPKILSFEEYAILEKKGDLKKLIGKKENDELTVEDAKKIGKKIASMSGTDRRKYVGIINFLGASCDIHNAIWKEYTKHKKDNKKSKKSKEKNEK